MFWKIKAFLYTLFRGVYPFSLFVAEENRAMAALLSDIDPEGCRMADVGCGTGNVLHALRINYPGRKLTITCIDHSPEMLSRIRPSEGVTAILADAEAMPFPTGRFDLVFCVGVMEYVTEHQILLAELKRVCDPKGSLFITFARPVFWNFLRNFYGKRVHQVDLKTIRPVLYSLGLEISKEATTRLQYQLLLKHLSDV